MLQTGILKENEIDPDSNGRKDVFTMGDISQLATKKYSIQVLRNRFLISTGEEKYCEQLVRVTSRIFALLSHTPVSAIGFNFDCIIKLDKNDYGSKYNSLFIGDAQKLDSIVGRNWRVNAILINEEENPKMQLSFSHLDNPKDSMLIGANFHYSEINGAISLKKMIKDRYTIDQRKFMSTLEEMLL
ncbi:MAG: hypothetical protein NUW37_02535 [Planctomycetes bacterium]|nr:hypothetical protein [Planctomycetota bacterium]